MTKTEAKAALKDAAKVVRHAIEGGILDGIHHPQWPDLGWRHCDRWHFREGKRRLDELLAGTGVQVHVKSRDRAEDYQLVARLDGPRSLELRTVRRGTAVYMVDGCTGRRA